MPIFTPGRTTCVICNDSIPSRVDAAVLPLINPSQYPELAPWVWRFAHRNCWERHPQREMYAHAARKMLLEAGPPPSTPVQFEQEGLFLLAVPAVQAVRVKDTLGLLETDVPVQQASSLAEAMDVAFAQQKAAEFSTGHGAWKLAPGQRGVMLTLVSHGEPFERMEIPRERFAAWEALALKLRQVAASRLSDQTGSPGRGR